MFFRTAGNAAYIFGTLAEHDVGQTRVLELINGPYPHHILADLTDMLAFDDPESVMNAAGTIGTLVSKVSSQLVQFPRAGCWGIRIETWINWQYCPLVQLFSTTSLFVIYTDILCIVIAGH